MAQNKDTITAKKSLGQNFLHNKAIVQKIANAGLEHTPHKILEIGPGMGVLTEVLIELSQPKTRIYAVEKDDRLIPILSEKFKDALGSGKLTLLHKDILEFSLDEIGIVDSGKKGGEGSNEDKASNNNDYAVIANIPYYITGEILKKFLEIAPVPKVLILLVQKEVADRIMARDKHTILSTITHILAKPKVISVVGRHNFSPQPNVDSAILELVPHKNHNSGFSPQDFKNLFDFIKLAFHSRRKTLVANLRDHYDLESVRNALTSLNLPLDIRAEDIDPTMWISLFQKVEKHLAKNQ